MKAIILAGGFGKRLKPITDYVPKPLVPIKNIPIIDWQIKYLKKFGVDEVIVSTGYRKDMIKDYLKSKECDIHIKYSHEKSPLGTGGAIKKAGKLIKDDVFFVMNGDIITNIDLNRMISTPNSIASIELRTNFGVLDVKNDKITKFREKKEISNLWMNAGIYFLERKILKNLPLKGDIEKTFFPEFAEKNLLNLIKFKNVKWFSIDSFKDIEESSKEIEKMIK